MGCSRPGDAEVRQNLPGKWKRIGGDPGITSEITWTVDSSGGYVCQIVSLRPEEAVPRTNHMAGKLEVRDGVLIDTMTENSNTNARLPMISRYRIVRSDRRELVFNWEADGRGGFQTNEVVFRKEIK